MVGNAERPEEAIELARQLTVRRAGEVRSWLILAQMLSGDTALEERLAACEKALSLNPRSIEVADLKATLLSQAKRFDEALAACLPAAWSGSPPLPMRGRAAWILAQRGKLPEAIQQMRAILHEEPFYYWGWQTLCHWLQSGKNGADFLDAASEMAKFFPNDVGTLTRLARAKFATHKEWRARQPIRACWLYHRWMRQDFVSSMLNWRITNLTRPPGRSRCFSNTRMVLGHDSAKSR